VNKYSLTWLALHRLWPWLAHQDKKCRSSHRVNIFDCDLSVVAVLCPVTESVL